MFSALHSIANNVVTYGGSNNVTEEEVSSKTSRVVCKEKRHFLHPLDWFYTLFRLRRFVHFDWTLCEMMRNEDVVSSFLCCTAGLILLRFFSLLLALRFLFARGCVHNAAACSIVPRVSFWRCSIIYISFSLLLSFLYLISKVGCMRYIKVHRYCRGCCYLYV